MRGNPDTNLPTFGSRLFVNLGNVTARAADQIHIPASTEHQGCYSMALVTIATPTLVGMADHDYTNCPSNTHTHN
ncbi:hypothetical protein BD779DRAFT_482699 [Infundibulicybe gibba]|nr:hypothetical protein BD779DRAFT_482699 [Infundibulicybe gibba]